MFVGVCLLVGGRLAHSVEQKWVVMLVMFGRFYSLVEFVRAAVGVSQLVGGLVGGLAQPTSSS